MKILEKINKPVLSLFEKGGYRGSQQIPLTPFAKGGIISFLLL